MHVAMADYDVTRGDGATVGYNFDQTIAPGGSITYQWQIPQISGATLNLVDFGDRRGHRHHGLFGALLVEPTGSTWTDPTSGKTVLNGTRADIRWTDAGGVAQAYREFAIFWQDGLNLRDPEGDPVPASGVPGDPYEGGHRGISYATNRFAARLATNPEPAYVLSSQHHGDPATPILRANVGDPVRVRLLQGADRGRAHTFLLAGHGWHYQRNDSKSTIRSAQGMVMPGRSFTFDLVGGAGGPRSQPGDYLYRDALIPNQVDMGLWGFLRVGDAQQSGLKPLRKASGPKLATEWETEEETQEEEEDDDSPRSTASKVTTSSRGSTAIAAVTTTSTTMAATTTTNPQKAPGAQSGGAKAPTPTTTAANSARRGK
jgi:hypothetical protein